MGSQTAQEFLREIHSLVSSLRDEQHPSVAKVLPLFNEQNVKEVMDCWQTLTCVKNELRGLRATLQNLTHLVLAMQQQLYHPSDCRHFSLAENFDKKNTEVVSKVESGLPPSASSKPVEKSTRGRKKKCENSNDIKIDKNLFKMLMQQNNLAEMQSAKQSPLLNYQQPQVYLDNPNIETSETGYCQYPANPLGAQYSPVSDAFDLDLNSLLK